MKLTHREKMTKEFAKNGNKNAFLSSFVSFLRLFLRMQNGSYGRGGDLKRSILLSVDQM